MNLTGDNRSVILHRPKLLAKARELASVFTTGSPELMLLGKSAFMRVTFTG